MSLHISSLNQPGADRNAGPMYCNITELVSSTGLHMGKGVIGYGDEAKQEHAYVAD